MPLRKHDHVNKIYRDEARLKNLPDYKKMEKWKEKEENHKTQSKQAPNPYLFNPNSQTLQN